MVRGAPCARCASFEGIIELRVESLRCRVQGHVLGFVVQGSCFRVHGAGLVMFEGSRFRVHLSGVSVSGQGFRGYFILAVCLLKKLSIMEIWVYSSRFTV